MRIQERGISGKCSQVTSNKMAKTPCEAQDTEIHSLVQPSMEIRKDYTQNSYESHNMMNYKAICVRFSREIVTNQATVTSSVELQPVFLIYAMYRIFAMVKIIPQV